MQHYIKKVVILFSILIFSGYVYSQLPPLPKIEENPPNKGDEQKNPPETNQNEGQTDNGIIFKLETIENTALDLNFKGSLTYIENNTPKKTLEYGAKGILDIKMQDGKRLYSYKYKFEKPIEFEHGYSYLSDSVGNMTVAPNNFEPYYRNIPCFPDKALKIGDGWYSKAYKVLEFTNENIEKPDIYPIDMFYRYEGITDYRNDKVYYFTFWGVEDFNSGFAILPGNVTNDKGEVDLGAPARIMGEISGKILMSTDKLLIVYQKVTTDKIYAHPNGLITEYMSEVEINTEKIKDK